MPRTWIPINKYKNCWFNTLHEHRLSRKNKLLYVTLCIIPSISTIFCIDAFSSSKEIS